VKAIESATSAIRPAAAAPGTADAHPSAGELTSWLIEARFFTVDPRGVITTWSPAAAEAFGWRRKDIVGRPFVDTLLAPDERTSHGGRFSELLSGGTDAGPGFTGDVDAIDVEGRPLLAAFAMVPIQTAIGYEFNALLQDVATRSADVPAAELKARHDAAMAMIEAALAGRTGGEDEAKVAGALVVFQSGSAAAAVAGPSAPVADNVVSISDAGGLDEARAQLERARRDADEGRVEIRSLEGQLEEARREAQRSRNEADVARQEAADARDTLIVTQRGAEEARRQLEDTRRTIDEVRAGAEAGRIRSEDAQREADNLRAQLREARDSARGMVGRADDDLAELQERAARTERELAEARAEAARHAAEVAPLRERYQAAQRELGALRADLESAQATVAERETLGDRRAGELERTRAELDARVAESSAARREVDQLRGELDARVAESSAARREVEELRGELEARTDELSAAREELDANAAQVAAAREQPDGRAATAAPDGEDLPALREQVERMRAAFDRAPVGGVLIAPDGRFLDVGESLCETLGHRRERLLSGEPPAIMHPDDVDAHRDLARRMLAGEQATARGYRRYLHADGHTVTMRESVSLVRDGEGRPTMFVVQLEEAHAEKPDLDADATVEVPALTDIDLRADGVTGTEVRRAIEDELLQLHCQPVLDLHSNTIAQYELLIRMTTPDGRLVLPQAFLGPARRAGLAHAIDRWVVRKAIRLLHETALAGQDVSLEVNLSPEAVYDTELPAMVDEELARTPVDPARLVFEVTGATAADHLEETRTLAKRLRGLGCRFALDDFRSSFGSFRLLRDLPLDYLKLDGELVGSLAESRTSQLIVKALVDVAAGAGMKTVAVFVSDQETIELLREQGVDFAQGYAVGRPRPVHEVLAQQEHQAQLPPG
jgi:PAS domain S-box-containing protein